MSFRTRTLESGIVVRHAIEGLLMYATSPKTAKTQGRYINPKP